MTRIFLSTAAALAIGLGAGHAQSDRQERGGASAQPRSEESRPAAHPRDTQRAPQRAQSNERSPAGDRGTVGSGSAGRDAAQRPAEAGRSGSDARPSEAAPGRADRGRDRSQRDTAETERDRSMGRDSTRSRDVDRDRSASERRQDRAGDRASRRDRDAAGRDRDAPESRRSRETVGTERDRGIERDRAAERDRAPADRSDRAARTERSTRGDVSVSGEQRERISRRFASRIDSMNVRSVSRSQVSVSVGATIPSSVRLYPVPSDIVAIYPRFRGHQFVLVEDEIVIIEPRTRRIVTTIERSDGAVASRSSRTTTGTADSAARIRLSPEERQVIRTTVVQEPACRFEQRIDFFIGIPLPSTTRICEFPERVVTEVPEVRRYRYVVRDEEVVVVDPDERRVIEVIR